MENHLKFVWLWGNWGTPQTHILIPQRSTRPSCYEIQPAAVLPWAIRICQKPEVICPSIQMGEVRFQSGSQFIEFLRTGFFQLLGQHFIAYIQTIEKSFRGFQHGMRVNQQGWLAQDIITHCQLDHCKDIPCISSASKASWKILLELNPMPLARHACPRDWA